MLPRRFQALLVTALLVAAACSTPTGATSSPTSSAAASPKSGGTLTTAVAGTIASFDPVNNGSADSYPIIQSVAEPLAYFDADQKLQPLLATSWKASSDLLTWTFTLRQGVKFSDGEDFKADSVKFTFDRLLDTTTVGADPQSLSVIKETKIIDDYNVEFDLKRPFAPFPAALTPANASIVAKGASTKAPNTVQKLVTPIGTGPYVIKEFVPNDHITLARNDGYWGKKPSYQTQVIRFVPEAATREALLLSKQADVVALPPISDLPKLRSDPGVKLVKAPSGYMIQMWFNTLKPQLKDPRVRVALQYAVDRAGLIKNLLFDTGAIADSPLAANVFGYCTTGTYEYNPEKAKQLLADAGATNLSLTMQSPQGRYNQDYQVAQAVAADLQKVGVKVQVGNPSDFPSYVAKLFVPPEKAAADLSLIGWGATYSDASQAINEFMSDQIPPKGSNATYYTNPKFDQYMAAAAATSDTATRASNYCNADKELWSNPPAIFLYTQQTVWATTSQVNGVYGDNLWFVTTWATPAQ